MEFKSLILIKNLQVGKPITATAVNGMIRGITKKNLLLTQSPERNANTKIKLDATTPLHPVLPADIAEIPTAQTVVY